MKHLLSLGVMSAGLLFYFGMGPVQAGELLPNANVTIN